MVHSILSTGGTGVPPAPVSRSAVSLVSHARSVLAEAVDAPSAAERFRLAHLSALRTAAALLAERARPASGPRRLRSAWVLIDSTAPEFSDWAAYFASGAGKREAIEAGSVNVVTSRDADDQLRAAFDFLRIVEGSLGLLAEPIAS
ncbi:hypothetical protein SAMN05892883_3526 [Jatrophihabitans sp. GAS493]|uniref:SAV_6107 family HEPN domain-containing protein n=1 Tax=Jatrophihabitans sp. GAS493 TaxID=1907575 RepID=UPI000BB7F557|nr:SAV_6107 family HEPN domain-containing protein [Jatrophihabitans sp. GAS493]SOD74342.1 hypothetical protein SAMN05892883_3526 [Jatrophihabitans sp. GAS493]